MISKYLPSTRFLWFSAPQLVIIFSSICISVHHLYIACDITGNSRHEANPLCHHMSHHNSTAHSCLNVGIYFFIFFISWRLITSQYCSGFCHTLTRISHGFTCIPHRDPPSHLPLRPIPQGLPSAPGPSTCLMHLTWTGHLFQPRQYTCFDAVLLKHPTLAFSHRVQKSVLYIYVSFCVLHIELSLTSF